MRVGIVAGESSGDFLGAGLIRAIRARVPDAVFEGIAGPRMQAEGCQSLYPMERLSVVGLVEVLGRYLELRSIRAGVIRHFRRNPPDVFVGIDAPEFNLGIERALRSHGIRTVQYVSPQVWAWRRGRVHTIRESVDRILTLFPFEADFYHEAGVPVTFVGHPLADEISPVVADAAARERLKLPETGEIIALLPGSRVSEVRHHADLFVQTALWLHQQGLSGQDATRHFVIPFVSRDTMKAFDCAIERNAAWDLPLTRVHGHARDVLTACDVALMASGTATLEAMLLGRLTVVAYRVAPLSHWILRRLMQVDRISLPNHLSGRYLVPEYIQSEAVPEKIGPAVVNQLQRRHAAFELQRVFPQIHATLRRNASERAAEAVLAVAAGNS